jgi:hypothetical protein
MMEDQKFWIHADGYFYTGDETEGAKEATQEEINEKLNPKSEIVTPPVNQDVADLWQAMLTMSAELEALKGGN